MTTLEHQGNGGILAEKLRPDAGNFSGPTQQCPTDRPAGLAETTQGGTSLGTMVGAGGLAPPLAKLVPAAERFPRASVIW